MGLQILFSKFARRSHRLAGKSSWKRAVRLGHRVSDETERRVQWPTDGRVRAPRVPGDGRASPAPWPRRPRRARARLNVASARPSHPALPFRSRRLLFLTAAAAERPPLRRRHSSAQLVPGHSRTTVIAPPSPQHPIVSPRARWQSPVSHRSACRLAGVPPWAPSSWPRRHSTPPAPVASALGPPAFIDACPRVDLNHRSPHRRFTVDPHLHPAMAAAVAASSDEKATQVAQSMREVE